jgi:hypothetical protein
MKYRPLAVFAIAALAACDAQTDRPEPGIAGQFVPGATAEAAAAKSSPAEYVLTMEGVRRALEAQRNIALAAGMDPRIAAPTGTEPLDEQVAMLDAVPALREAVAKAGLTTREQVVARSVLFQAGMAHGVIDAGEKAETVLASIRIAPENVEFFRANREQIARLQKAVEDEVNEGEVLPGPLAAGLDEN